MLDKKLRTWLDSRSGDDDLGIDELTVKSAVLALLVAGRHEGVTLILEPFSETELVLGCPEQLGDLLGMLVAIVEDEKNFTLSTNVSIGFLVERRMQEQDVC